MPIHHTPQHSTESETIATSVEIGDTLLKQTRGLMFRQEIPDDYGFVMPFSKAKIRGVHTAFVFKPIDVVWTLDETVVKVKRFNPFRTVGFKKSDCITELPAGAAEDITVGDSLSYSTETEGGELDSNGVDSEDP